MVSVQDFSWTPLYQDITKTKRVRDSGIGDLSIETGVGEPAKRAKKRDWKTNATERPQRPVDEP